MADIQEALNLQSQGKLDEAQKIYLDFLEENPKQPDVSNLMGLIFLQKNDLENALKYFEYAAEGFPCAEYCQNLGLVQYKQKDFSAAMENFSKAVDFESENIDFIRNIAQMAKKANQADYGIKFFEKCLKFDPEDPVGWNNIGLLYEQKHDYKSAKDCYIKSLKVKENYEAAHNLGVLHRMERNFTESLRCLKQALKLKPNAEFTLLALGMTYLSLKDFENGYKYYMTKKPEVFAQYKNHWDGNAHPDSTLLVYYDSGFGDQIMFCRYLNYVKEKFKKVKLFTHPGLKKLFDTNFPDIEVVARNDVEYDFSDNIMYLNYHLGMDFDSIPCSSGYLAAENSTDERFNVNDKKIGLFWQGNYDGYSNRAIKLKELAPILGTNGCKFFGFVKEDKENQIAEFPQIIDIGSGLGDFYDTASKLLNLDLFITIDTAAANLAGALGVKTFLLLPYASEWRWFDDTKTTPWYDSVTIFKQKEHWNWAEVVEEINGILKKSD